MKFLFSLLVSLLAICASAQKAPVSYLEKIGNGGTRVFAVEVPAKDVEVKALKGTEKLKPEEYACYSVINAILFDGVPGYNMGMPLVENPNDAFAKSVVDPKTKAFMSYCKEKAIENTQFSKKSLVLHYYIEVNNFNLIKLLKLRGSRTDDVLE